MSEPRKPTSKVVKKKKNTSRPSAAQIKAVNQLITQIKKIPDPTKPAVGPQPTSKPKIAQKRKREIIESSDSEDSCESDSSSEEE